MLEVIDLNKVNVTCPCALCYEKFFTNFMNHLLVWNLKILLSLFTLRLATLNSIEIHGKYNVGVYQWTFMAVL
jgi:hypothetical protein